MTHENVFLGNARQGVCSTPQPRGIIRLSESTLSQGGKEV